jgi:hypothetical protein
MWFGRFRKRRDLLKEALAREVARWESIPFSEWAEQYGEGRNYVSEQAGERLDCSMDIYDLEKDCVVASVSVAIVVPSHGMFMLPIDLILQQLLSRSETITVVRPSNLPCS